VLGVEGNNYAFGVGSAVQGIPALHPYTKALLSAIPIPDPVVEAKRQRIILSGDVPSPMRPPPGCVFHTRCPIASDAHGCRTVVPEWRNVGTSRNEHWVACHRV